MNRLVEAEYPMNLRKRKFTSMAIHKAMVKLTMKLQPNWLKTLTPDTKSPSVMKDTNIYTLYTIDMTLLQTRIINHQALDTGTLLSAKLLTIFFKTFIFKTG